MKEKELLDIINVEYRRFKDWVAKQPLPVEAAIVTGITAIRSACIGFFVDIFVNGYPPSFDPQSFRVPGGYQPLINQLLGGGPIISARNLAIRSSCNHGVSLVMERIRGKNDVYSEAVSGFSSGILLSLVTGMRGPSVVSIGVLFALGNMGIFKACEKFKHDKLSRRPGEDGGGEEK